MGSKLTVDHLRALPDGSLTRAEVALLCDEIERLRHAIGEQTAKNTKLVTRVHNLERARYKARQRAAAFVGENMKGAEGD